MAKTSTKKPKQYPEQSLYIKGNKVWLELDNEQELIISPQAREILNFYGIDEEKFIQKLKEILLLCTNVKHGMTFHHISVSKASITELNDDEGWASHLRIDIYDIYGEA